MSEARSHTERPASARPVVTIGLPVYNGALFIREALESLLRQTFTEFEVLISDNASTDATPVICREYAAKDDRIRYIRQPANSGIMWNVTFVAENAKGAYFMLAGDDDVYEPQYLDRLMTLLVGDPGLDMVYSSHGFVDPAGVVSASTLKTFLRARNTRFSNFAVFLRVRICLPMMMGVFRTASFLRALPFISLRDRMTGGIDIVFLLRFLTYAKVDSVDEVLFYYRSKDRSCVTPVRWRSSRWAMTWGRFTLNREILTKHIFPIVAGSEFNPLQKLFLRFYATAVFISDFSLFPVVQYIKARASINV